MVSVRHTLSMGFHCRKVTSQFCCGGENVSPLPLHTQTQTKEIKEQFSVNNDLAIPYEIVLKLKKFPHLGFRDVFLKKRIPNLMVVDFGKHFNKKINKRKATQFKI